MQHCTDLPGFTSFRFVGRNGEARCVYHSGEGPAVVIMHELPGLNAQCIALAEDIRSAGFAVYLPLLFGRPGRDLGILPGFSLCIRREFALFATGKRSPVTAWLFDLCTHVHAMSGSRGIGLVGMCITGGLVFALCASPAVMAAVTCQPSLPISLFRGARVRADLGTAAADLDIAQSRMRKHGIEILGFRYSSDRSSPPERFEAAKCIFGDCFRATTYATPDPEYGLTHWAHSVLTGTYDPAQPASHPAHRARRDVIAYLKKRLLRAG